VPVIAAEVDVQQKIFSYDEISTSTTSGSLVPSVVRTMQMEWLGITMHKISQ